MEGTDEKAEKPGGRKVVALEAVTASSLVSWRHMTCRGWAARFNLTSVHWSASLRPLMFQEATCSRRFLVIGMEHPQAS
jgi:hypothetical protein